MVQDPKYVTLSNPELSKVILDLMDFCDVTTTRKVLRSLKVQLTIALLSYLAFILSLLSGSPILANVTWFAFVVTLLGYAYPAFKTYNFRVNSFQAAEACLDFGLTLADFEAERNTSDPHFVYRLDYVIQEYVMLVSKTFDTSRQ